MQNFEQYRNWESEYTAPTADVKVVFLFGDGSEKEGMFPGDQTFGYVKAWAARHFDLVHDQVELRDESGEECPDPFSLVDVGLEAGSVMRVQVCVTGTIDPEFLTVVGACEEDAYEDDFE